MRRADHEPRMYKGESGPLLARPDRSILPAKLRDDGGGTGMVDVVATCPVVMRSGRRQRFFF
jgi:hypothetical protein